MGCVRLLLRLGECADGQAPRRRILAATRHSRGRARPRVGVAAPAVCRFRSRRRPIGSLGSIGPPRCSSGHGADCVARATDRESDSFVATYGHCRFWAAAPFQLAIAPYGILQSLLRDRDLNATLRSVSEALVGGGTFGIDLVPGFAHLGGVREPGQPDGPPQSEGRPPHPDRIGAPGSGETPDDLRSTLRRAARREARRASVLADVSHDGGPSDDPPSRACRISCRCGPG